MYLHREVRQTLECRSAVEQAGDIGVFQAGENLTLVPEAADDGLRVHAALQDLDRHPLLVGVVAADGEVPRFPSRLAPVRESDDTVQS